MRYFVFFLVSAGAFAQVIGNPFVPQQPPLIQLKEFLQLTDAQYSTLFQNMGQYQRTVSERQLRMSTVRNEIATETARENPDPTELGTRYAEIELICRGIDDEAKRLQERNRALLTDAQKARLKLLDDAWKLLPTISQAQQVMLLDGTAGIGIPTAAYRSGDFSAIVPPPAIFTSGAGCSVRSALPVFTPTP